MGNRHNVASQARVDTLQTGDVLLFAEEDDEPVAGQRNWTFCALVVRDPSSKPQGGVYMLHLRNSGTAVHKHGVGVQLTLLQQHLSDERYRSAAVRRVRYMNDPPSEDEVERLLMDVLVWSKEDKALVEWVEQDHMDIFWCSALTAYALTRFGVLQCDVDWTLLTPDDLGKDPLPYESGARLEGVEELAAFDDGTGGGDVSW